MNSICTIRGGTHVTHVSDQIVEAILEKVKAQSKEKVKGGVDVKPHHVRRRPLKMPFKPFSMPFQCF